MTAYHMLFYHPIYVQPPPRLSSLFSRTTTPLVAAGPWPRSTWWRTELSPPAASRCAWVWYSRLLPSAFESSWVCGQHDSADGHAVFSSSTWLSLWKVRYRGFPRTPTFFSFHEAVWVYAYCFWYQYSKLHEMVNNSLLDGFGIQWFCPAVD